MSEEIHHSISTRLVDADQRYTSGRRTLVDILRTAGRPLTAGEVSTAGGLSQSSAYRNLAVLEAAGVVLRVAGTDEFARFELAEDLTDHHHHHLICTSCGRVSDFDVCEGLEQSLDDAMVEAARATGFRTDQHRLDLIGRCADCS